VVQVETGDFVQELLRRFASISLYNVLKEVLHLVNVVDEDLKQVFYTGLTLVIYVKVLVLL